jgi:hypothetical protein
LFYLASSTLPWRSEMLEFKSRIVVLAVVAAAAVASVLANYGWHKPPLH